MSMDRLTFLESRDGAHYFIVRVDDVSLSERGCLEKCCKMCCVTNTNKFASEVPY